MRAAAIGIWGGVSGLGVALGPVIGGAVVEGVSWQAIFWLNVPVALVAVPLLLVAIPESRGAWQKLDPIGVLLLGGAVFLGIWGIVHGNDDGWSDPRVARPAGARGGCCSRRTSLWARGRAYAVLPLRLFSAPEVHGRQRHLPDVHARHVRHRLPARAVPPDRAGLHARSRPASARCRGPPRRWWSRRSPAPWSAGSATGRCSSPAWCSRPSSLVWFAVITENGSVVLVLHRAAGHGRRRHGAGLRPGRVDGARRAAGRRLRDRQLGQLHDPRVRRRARHRRPGRGVPRQRRRSSPRPATTARSARRC